MAESLQLEVIAIRDLAEGIRAFDLRTVDGSPLPPFDAGAHLRIDVTLPDGEPGVREYSLVNDPDARDHYEIAVLHEANGRGGSASLHRVRVGDVLTTSAPRSAFALADGDAHLLIAGGIGITPLLCMARTLRRRGSPLDIHYAARSPERMAYREALEELGARLYFDGGDPSRGIPIATLLGEPRAGRHLYVCGPAPLIAVTLDTAAALGWSADHVHHESFGGAVARAGDRPIRVHLRSSGRTVDVAADESILDALLREGLDPLFDCRRGECGLCVTEVVEGIPDHRDQALTAREHDSGRVMCTCVSRAKTPELTLDL